MMYNVGVCCTMIIVLRICQKLSIYTRNTTHNIYVSAIIYIYIYVCVYILKLIQNINIIRSAVHTVLCLSIIFSLIYIDK